LVTATEATQIEHRPIVICDSHIGYTSRRTGSHTEAVAKIYKSQSIGPDDS